MNKKIYSLAILFCLIAVSFVSCSSDDNDNIDRVWKERNEKIFNDAEATHPSVSQSKSGNGFVRFKASNELGISTYMTADSIVQFSDKVECLYKGWFIKEDGTEHVFDSTADRNNVPALFHVGKDVIDGFSTVLQGMRIGEEREVCIPQKLAYGASGQDKVVPGYTTLFFQIKVTKIIPVNPDEFAQ